MSIEERSLLAVVIQLVHKHELKQEDIAKAIGKHQGTVSQALKGKNKKTLHLIAEYFRENYGYSAEDLYGNNPKFLTEYERAVWEKIETLKQEIEDLRTSNAETQKNIEKLIDAVKEQIIKQEAQMAMLMGAVRLNPKK